MFDKVLVANRGEIAKRIITTAKALGYRTVAVYSEPDSQSPHVSLADEAVCLGAGAASDSYLNIDNILKAARMTEANAIHPGYGFLSENSAFAEACQLEGIIFIGPNTSAIELMGSKRAAKEAMITAGVPCIPGYEGKDQSDSVLIDAANDIGFPLMVKASAGGGGRGMRIVEAASDLAGAIKSARSEALNAFGSDELILEKALRACRHIEIQIFADNHNNVVHLGERDCSMQRRHQKVIEEAPSPVMTPELRDSMGKAAIAAARACNYQGAGTVEFLLDQHNEFYFLEMNTRLQVEHPVTELITGYDLVEWQLRVAAGEPLPRTQDQLTINGHAIEVRLYAEDPANNFMPQTGEIALWQPASHDDQTGEAYSGVRVDSGIQEGNTVNAFYDPMLAKFITWGENREQARRRLVRLVQDSHLLGLRDNRSFLSELLQSDTFIQGQTTTDFIETEFTANPSLSVQEVSNNEWMLAALLLSHGIENDNSRLQTSMIGERQLSLGCGDVKKICRIQQMDSHQFCLQLDDTVSIFHVISTDDNQLCYQLNNVRQTITFHKSKANGFSYSLWLASAQGNLHFHDLTFQTSQNEKAGSNKVLASMDGVVIDVLFSEGQTVKQGEVVAIIEAMKMEHPLKAGVDGKIRQIFASPGDQVKGRQLLIEVEE
ncbi:acetyl/propionyl/methylcrotonyl-CoA carboxylase subunit alpha [Endozoicomonas ascidiicola]|uniref:acetyl/propionyl/methylcrotonyl-CoA carboxylase subunit alpha n=1 Tax=Endozoicomonas ascidiicola TaxID=1698521 RepID=UPI00083781D3|nr:acetyl-CoA carboxylase biotin carboxylase subunit [Endozoicomonas ascidiicola]